jgi:Ca2+-binding RTX toxin-like protein
MATKKGSNKNDTLKGTDSGDVLLGRGGDDTLIGGNGNDRLDGGKGAEELIGGKGNDLLLPGQGGADAMDGGDGIDTVSYANFVPSGSMGVIIQFDPDSTSTDLDAAGDDFANVERFVGTTVSDRFEFYRHDVSQGYYVKGGGGDDHLHVEGGIMRGGSGIDALYGDTKDQFVDTFWLELGKGGDEIVGFTNGQDIIRISGKEFGIGTLLNSDELYNQTNSTATGMKAQFIYRMGANQLYFDADGTGSQTAVMIADFGSNGPTTLSVADFEIV